MTERKKGPKPSQGTRTERITVKFHATELMEVLEAFADHKQHPATWLRNKALEYAYLKNLKA